MFTKRLFKHYSFIVILLLIPVIIPVANTVMNDGGGMLTIALVSNGGISDEIINTLTTDDTVIRYRIYDTEDEAKKAVERESADAAWIFPEDLDQKIKEFATGTKKPFVKIIQREENIPLRLSYEKLYGAIYPHITYELYKDYTYKELTTPEEVSEDVLKYTNDNINKYENIIKITRLDCDEEVVLSKNFLTIPLRGMLAIVVLLCSIAAAMYFLGDLADGKFDWLAPKKRLAPAFGSCFAAAVASSAAVFAALFASGIFIGFVKEFISMLLYAVAVSGFCLILCIVFRSAGKLGASIPFFVIVTLVLCPIFFNLNVLKPVKFMLPTFYYLQSLYNKEFMLYFVIYCAGVYGVAFLLNEILNFRDR